MNKQTQAGYAEWLVTELCDHLEQHHHALIRDLFPELAIQSRAAAKIDSTSIPEMTRLERLTAEITEELKQYLLFDFHILLPFLRYRGKYSESDVSQLADEKTVSFAKRARGRQAEVEKILDNLRKLTSNYNIPVDISPSAKHLIQALRELDALSRELFSVERDIIIPKTGLLDLPLQGATESEKKANRQNNAPMKPIFVCTDFSAGSDNAVRYAAQMALAFHAELILFHASHSSVSATGQETSKTTDEKQREAEARKKLDAVAAQLKKEHGMEPRTECVTGLPVEEIVSTASRFDAGLIITGARETAAGSGLVGGLVYDLMHSATRPVMAVPMGISFTPPKKIVLASDLQRGEQFDDSLLRSLVNRFNAQLLLVSVLSPGEKPGVEKAIAGVELEHRYADITHRLQLTEDESLVDGLNEFAYNHNADLVVIIPHRHNFLIRMMRATQTQKVLKGTHRPLLTLVNN
ncbi:MAG: UspA domain-containing protein [Bacteroidetes bacterium]|nr:MAG: UspA domain-containing protein [Bacteroidota bacterium]